jgi:hypothetical protein
MKIISIRQPWASLIVSSLKDVENRTWPTRYRGPGLIHASQRADNLNSEEIELRFGVRPPAELPLGGVAGITEIVDCVKDYPSEWYAHSQWAFVLANSRPLPFLKWKGQLGLREAPRDLLELLNISPTSREKEATIFSPSVPTVPSLEVGSDPLFASYKFAATWRK